MKTTGPDLQHAIQISAGSPPFSCDILRERGTDVLIARAPRASGGSAIYKCWNRPGPRGWLRRLTRTSTAHREWQALSLLSEQGIPTPKPFALLRLPGPPVTRHTECLVEEDLGPCADATEFFKQLIREKRQTAIESFDDALIASTRALLQSRLLDPDHRLPNFVIPPAGIPVRLDFELALRCPFPRLHADLYGRMLGTFLGSYVFAVQPDTQRATHFATRLIQSLNPPQSALRIAEARIAAMLERQRIESGIDTRFTPPWHSPATKGAPQ